MEQQDDKSADDSSFGWEELMGKDLLMKVRLYSAPRTARWCGSVLAVKEKLTHFLQTLSSSFTAASKQQSVQPQDIVMIDFTCRPVDGPNDPTNRPIFQKATGWLVEIGAKDVLPALEMGVRFMKVGDTAAVWSSSKYAYGPGRRKGDSSLGDSSDLLPHSNVLYEVTLRCIVEMNDYSTKLRLSQSRKAIGNDIYRYEYIQDDAYAKSRALSLYKRAATMLDQLLQDKHSNADDSVTAEATAALVDCLNNIAAVHLTCKSFHAAKEACVRVLEMDPNNAKALTRAAKAALDDPASSYEEVGASIAAADEVGADTNKLKRLLQKRRASHAKQSKKLYNSMAKGMIQRKKPEGTGPIPEANESDTLEQDKTEPRVGSSTAVVMSISVFLALALAFWLRASGSTIFQEL